MNNNQPNHNPSIQIDTKQQQTTNNNKMKKGTVKFFNETKGFGFIKAENGEEIFVHVSGLNNEIRENDEVTFDVQEGRKGLNAINVKLA